MKPSIPRGTRDFGPAEMQKRNYIFSVIRKNFELFGYQPIETPAMEKTETLLGKYGEEGDKLLYRIRSNKNLFKTYPESANKIKELLKNISDFDYTFLAHKSDKALRYDLTVPFARYVVQHQNEITFPFKRYQIQPVWRGDNPQMGRYREFFQCDADVIGSNSLFNEVELIQLIADVFSQLNIKVIIKINNRKILSGLAEVIGQKEKIIDITVAIDKLDKIGIKGVNSELKEKGISDLSIEKLQPLISFEGKQEEKLSFLKNLLANSEIGLKGISEIEYILDTLKRNWNFEYLNSLLELDITLARGLNYYTGAIIEVKVNQAECPSKFTSSILGGGRYDDLTGIFGLPNMSGVGISFGIDRIYDVMNEIGSFENLNLRAFNTDILIAPLGLEEQQHALKLAKMFRGGNGKLENRMKTEVYPDVTKKIGKQFEYADKKNIPFVCVVGSNEMFSEKYTLKNLRARTESKERSYGEMIEEIIKYYED
jgi:histidyl-tRNA synthetase